MSYILNFLPFLCNITFTHYSLAIFLLDSLIKRKPVKRRVISSDSSSSSSPSDGEGGDDSSSDEVYSSGSTSQEESGYSSSSEDSDPDKWGYGRPYKKKKGRRHDFTDIMNKNKYTPWQCKARKGAHPTHLQRGYTSFIPEDQGFPGYCLLCPRKKVLTSAYEVKCHYTHAHHNHCLCIGTYKIMRCKCTPFKSSGTDGAARNTHWHCTKCNWPRKDKEGLATHYMAKHGYAFARVQHWVPPKRKWKEYMEKDRRDKDKCK